MKETIEAKMKLISDMYLKGHLSAKEYREWFNSLWIELTPYIKGDK